MLGKVSAPGPGRPPAALTAELDVAPTQNVETMVGLVLLAVPVRVTAFVMLNDASVWPVHGRTVGCP